MPQDQPTAIPLCPIRIHRHAYAMIELRPDPAGSEAVVKLDEDCVRLPGGWMLPYEDLAELRYRSGPDARLTLAGASRTQHRWVLCALPQAAFAEADGAKRLYDEIRRRVSAPELLAQPNLGLRLRMGPPPILAVGLGLLMIALWYVQPMVGFGDRHLAALLLGAAVPDLVQSGELHRLFTAGLLHLAGWKLVVVLVGFVFLASVAERLWGTWRLALILLLVNVAGFAVVSLSGGAGFALGGTVTIAGLGAALWVQMARMGMLPRSGALLVGGVGLVLFSLETWVQGPFHLPAFVAGLLLGLLPLPEPGGDVKVQQVLRLAGQASLFLILAAVAWAGYDGLVATDRRLAEILTVLAAEEPPDCYRLNDYVERISFQPTTTPELHRATLQTAERCIRYHEQNPWLRAGLAGAYHRLGRYEQAAEEMRTALRLAEQAGLARRGWFEARLAAYETDIAKR